MGWILDSRLKEKAGRRGHWFPLRGLLASAVAQAAPTATSSCPSTSLPLLSPEPEEILPPSGHSNDKINKYIRQLKKNSEHCFFLDLQDTSSKISRKPLFSVWISINTRSLTDGKYLFISHINDGAASGSEWWSPGFAMSSPCSPSTRRPGPRR